MGILGFAAAVILLAASLLPARLEAAEIVASVYDLSLSGDPETSYLNPQEAITTSNLLFATAVDARAAPGREFSASPG
jgi:hypothetical protein